MEREETGGEAALHASQPGETRAGSVAGAVAVEQLSPLSDGRSRASAGERRVGRDFLSGSGGVGSPALNLPLPAFAVPALAKSARACPERSRRDGAPAVLEWVGITDPGRVGHPPSNNASCLRLQIYPDLGLENFRLQ